MHLLAGLIDNDGEGHGEAFIHGVESHDNLVVANSVTKRLDPLENGMRGGHQ